MSEEFKLFLDAYPLIKFVVYYIPVCFLILTGFWIRDRLIIQRINREIADEHSRPSNWL